MSKRAKYDPLTVLKSGATSEGTAARNVETSIAPNAVSEPKRAKLTSRTSSKPRSRPGRTQLNVSISPEAKARLDALMDGLPRSVTRADVIEHCILKHGDTAASQLQQST